MSKVIPLVLLCTMVVLTCGCQKNASASKQTVTAEPHKVKFVPPSDSSVTTDQVKKWILCNTYLDSLSILYKDSFLVSDAAKQTRYQENFVKAQDRLCVRVGMSGGYAEYLWILRNIGNPKNKRIVDSLKLATFR